MSNAAVPAELAADLAAVIVPSGKLRIEEPDHSSSNWYYTRQDIEENSPSRKDGIELRRENILRKSYCSFCQDLGMRLKVPQYTIATAIVFCHRFFMCQSHAKNDGKTIATIAMFLAGKVEETPRPLKDVIYTAHEVRCKTDKRAAEEIRRREVFEKHKDLLLDGERVLLTTLNFDLHVLHPYKPLVQAIKKVGQGNLEHKRASQLAQVSWNFVNDGLRTSLCLQFRAHVIAAGSLYLAAKFLRVRLPVEEWAQEVEVLVPQLEEVSSQLLELYEHTGARRKNLAMITQRGEGSSGSALPFAFSSDTTAISVSQNGGVDRIRASEPSATTTSGTHGQAAGEGLTQGSEKKDKETKALVVVNGKAESLEANGTEESQRTLEQVSDVLVPREAPEDADKSSLKDERTRPSTSAASKQIEKVMELEGHGGERSAEKTEKLGALAQPEEEQHGEVPAPAPVEAVEDGQDVDMSMDEDAIEALIEDVGEVPRPRPQQELHEAKVQRAKERLLAMGAGPRSPAGTHEEQVPEDKVVEEEGDTQASKLSPSTIDDDRQGGKDVGSVEDPDEKKTVEDAGEQKNGGAIAAGGATEESPPLDREGRAHDDDGCREEEEEPPVDDSNSQGKGGAEHVRHKRDRDPMPDEDDERQQGREGGRGEVDSPDGGRYGGDEGRLRDRDRDRDRDRSRDRDRERGRYGGSPNGRPWGGSRGGRERDSPERRNGADRSHHSSSRRTLSPDNDGSSRFGSHHHHHHQHYGHKRDRKEYERDRDWDRRGNNKSHRY